MKIGILTGGGDTAALNATLYGILLEAHRLNHQVFGFRYGWKGALNPADYLLLQAVDPNQGGTILKTSRTKLKGATIDEAAENIERLVDAFIGIGGDDTLSVGKILAERLKIPVCFVTKTIDNDVGRNAPAGDIDFSDIVNYFTLGFPTACARIVDYASQLRTTAYSHDRVMFLEAMGRKPGWLALASYRADPDFIIIPEVGLNYGLFLEKLVERYNKEKNVIVVVAEGARYEGQETPISEDANKVDAFGHKKLGGVTQILADRVKKDTKIENCNYINPGHLYRSGPPTGFDRETAISLGKLAANNVFNGLTGGVAVVQREGSKIVTATRPIDEVLLADSTGRIIPRTVDLRFYDTNTYSITGLGREYFKLIR